MVVVNSREPRSEAARELCSRIQEEYQVKALCADCQTMSAQEIAEFCGTCCTPSPCRSCGCICPGGWTPWHTTIR